MENKSSSRNNNVLPQSNTHTNRRTRRGNGKVNANLSANIAATAAAAVASLDITDDKKQHRYSQASQKRETKRSTRDHTFGDTLIRSKHLQDGQVPEVVQHLTATKVNKSNVDSNNLEKDVDNVTKQDKNTDIDCNKHGKHTSFATANTNKPSKAAERCSSISTSTTAAAKHQKQQEAATMSTVTVPSCPPILPTSAKDSARQHYVVPTQQATASRLVAHSSVKSLPQKSNGVNNASDAQQEALPVAVPAKDVQIHVYAVSHDVSQDVVHKRIQMVRVRRDSRRLYFVVFLLVAAAVMIASIVALMRNKDNGHEQEQETERTMIQNMTQLIVSIMGADAVLLNDASSPYAKALTWLLQSSNGKKSKKMMSTLAQRFYLASFYYDTTSDDDKWTDCNPPNSTFDKDQTCYDIYYNTTSKAWLSESHECDWAGVICDYNQQIVVLALEGMNLVGTIPLSVAKFPFLYYLSLTGSQLEGNISLLSNCHHLTHIVLSNNSLSGDLSSVWQHRKLKLFEVGYNRVSGSLFYQIGNLVDLKGLGLYGNELTGTVPIEVGWLDSIYEFHIGNNRFRGELPRSMQLWSMIHIIDVIENSFLGSIPTFLGQLNKTLLILKLYGNEFTGTLPDELFHLTELMGLDVSNNELSGTLDARFAQFTNVQRNLTLGLLGLNDNHFTGSIPTELGLLSNLYVIYLQGNDFTGSVPASLCHNNVRDLSQLDYNDLYADFTLVADCTGDDNGKVEVQCDCCTKCCQADGTHCELQR